jgi:hypothetical protein
MVAYAFGDGHCMQGYSYQQLPQQEAGEHIIPSFNIICQHPLSAIFCSFFYPYGALQSLVAYAFGDGHCVQGDSHQQLPQIIVLIASVVGMAASFAGAHYLWLWCTETLAADAFGDGHCMQGDSHQQLSQQEAGEHIFSSFNVICQHPLSAIFVQFFLSL